MTRKTKSGFSLIEVAIALVVLSIMILASGSILVFLARGMTEARDDNDVQNRVEIVRELMVSDFRAGSAIVLPATAGTSAASVQVTTSDYNATTGVTTNRRYRWTLSGTTLTRYVATETSSGSGVYGAETTTFIQNNVASFSATHFDNGTATTSDDDRLDFQLSATQGTQSATIKYTVILRNVS
ncbi:MAG: prepilin-type N-terminal cleavage/methylation domain-containing protein [Planctomycetes bacterium]|nr:prepilin-type N-terminal cleavage/methylation domain-containing protein [Planctomycetota bacterium]